MEMLIQAAIISENIFVFLFIIIYYNQSYPFF